MENQHNDFMKLLGIKNDEPPRHYRDIMKEFLEFCDSETDSETTEDDK